MNLLSLIPKHKSDFSVIPALRELQEEDFETIAMPVLEWLQDNNWPIAAEIRDLVTERQNSMVGSILTVLDGTDEAWKYVIITNVLPKLRQQNVEQLLFKLYDMLEHPTPEEVDEEVYEEVAIFLYDNHYLSLEKPIQDFISSLWQQRYLPYIDGILKRDGKVFRHIVQLAKYRNREHIYHYLTNVQDYYKNFGDITIFQQVEYEGYHIYSGASSYGNYGWIFVLNEAREFEWLVMDSINPIVQLAVVDNSINAVNNRGELYLFPLKFPETFAIPQSGK